MRRTTLALLGSRVGNLDFDAEAAFNRFQSNTEREDEDRKQIQLLGVRRFEARRTIALEKVRDGHVAANRNNLVAAMEGQLENLKRKCAAQRQKLERKPTTGDCATVAAGFIMVR